ncbi:MULTISPECIES: hypothetical protein [Bradyrhizobium]|jgi:hypothetical protein|uniref:DUF1508 domain-containing protein n=2 Tax=Bradyrhizobium TaxID=374 RepID=A0ABY0Q6T0_9BRAD|nr:MULTISPECIES: hypothetical protein [Bradyrhizobium]SDJ61873.1 hypothetical protein SAMN05444163_5938 [Bradyrhizobium ottawaense]SEC35606.1 hypothetical protein SAMN05444171_1219 [Bradyrhizobium lablabi]SHK61652.1 hypothetical protein SAMN05444321_0058 [Bradyrhizobium lablabi]
MQYREIDYSLFGEADGRWSWKLHPKIQPGGMREIMGPGVKPCGPAKGQD